MNKRGHAALLTAAGLMILILLVGLSAASCGSASDTVSQPTRGEPAPEPSSTTTTTSEFFESTTVSVSTSTTTTEVTITTAEPTTTSQATTTPLQGSPLSIVAVNYNAAGNDNDNLNDEYITFRVLVSGSLLGYAVEDNKANHRYGFPDRTFEKDQTFTLHTGEGTDTQTDLYWGQSGSAVWNNDGDIVMVLDPRGQIVESYSY